MNDFAECLAMSHAADRLPIWREMYDQAFPEHVGIHCHRDDGIHQRNGIDRSVILRNGKQVTIDEKVRGRNKKTGKVYDDIALEYLSDEAREVPGWVCKPLLCDYIAYAIAPLGVGYLLPVIPLQQAWERHSTEWYREYGNRKAPNRSWTTVFCPVPAGVVLHAIRQCLVCNFQPIDYIEST
jgi:hypothetical protein